MLDILIPLSLHYPQAGYTPTQLRALADDWCEDLAAYPMPLLRVAVRGLRRRERYFPCVATLLDYAAAALRESGMIQRALPGATRSPEDQRRLNLEWARRILNRQTGGDPGGPGNDSGNGQGNDSGSGQGNDSGGGRISAGPRRPDWRAVIRPTGGR